MVTMNHSQRQSQRHRHASAPAVALLLLSAVTLPVQARIGSTMMVHRIVDISAPSMALPSSYHRLLADDCSDNAVAYNLNLDLQVPSTAASCSDTEDQEMAFAIADALDQNFATTVPDWMGQVAFSSFGFDAAQSTTSQRRRRRLTGLNRTCPSRSDVECPSGYSCAWGCLTADTTDCGTSSFANWANLADDVQVALQALNLNCLSGVQVVMQINDEFNPSTIATTTSSSSSTSSSVEEPSDREQQEDGGATSVSLTPRPTDAPTETPTEAPTVDDGFKRVDVSVTRPPQEPQETERTGEQDDNGENVDIESNPNGQTDGDDSPIRVSAPVVSMIDISGANCQDNPMNYQMYIDLQMANGNECLAEQEQTVQDLIDSTLNQKVATTVSDWQGSLGFSAVNLDACGDRSPDIPCETGNCKWACLTMATTDCGTSSLANVALLAEDLQTALGQGTCLGDDLVVNVLIGDEVAEGGETEEEEEEEEEEVESQDDEDVTTAPAPTPQPTFGLSIALPVKSKLEFTFFEGTGREPTLDEIKALVEESIAYWNSYIGSCPGFGDVFQFMQMTHLIPQYDGARNPDVFYLLFLAQVYVDEEAASQLNILDAANCLAASDFQEYIRDYIRHSDSLNWTEFYDTHIVRYRGTVPAHLVNTGQRHLTLADGIDVE